MEETPEERPLGSFAKVQAGFTFKSSDFSSKGIPVVKIKNITPPTVDVQNIEYVAKEAVEAIKGLERFVVRPGDILIAMTGATLGKVGRIPNTNQVVLLNQRVGRISVTNPSEVDANYLYFVLSHDAYFSQISSMGQGSAQANISSTQIESLQVQIPSLLEQQAASHALSAVQDSTQLRKRERGYEQERKTALMQHLFTYGIHGEITKQTEIGEMPGSWQVTKLVDVSDIRYGLGQPPEFDSCGIPMVRATDIKKGRIVSGTIKCVRQESVPKSRDPYLKKGDLLVVRSGAYTGDAAMYDGMWKTAIAGYDLVVSPMTAKINPEFLAFYILGETAQRYFQSQRDRSAQPHLNSKQLGETLIPLPSLQEQIEVKNVLEALERRILLLETERDLLEELFNSMLDELITGRLSTKLLIQAGMT
jgi:type I restriction enzyme S subunit